MPKPQDPPVRVNRAYVVLELTDGSTAAYAINRPLETNLTTTANRTSIFDPYDNIYRMLPPFTHDLTFEFREVPEYRMVWLEPGVWQGFEFERPGLEAGDSRD